MKYEWPLALLIVAGAVIFYAVPVHRAALAPPVTWWGRVFFQAETNWTPNLRGLNVTVIGDDGSPMDSRSFDTYEHGDAAFARYVTGLPAKCWVLVTVRGEATNNLQETDLAALAWLGGTNRLAGKRHWAYILVGRPGLGAGGGLEELSEGALEILLRKGQKLVGHVFPLDLRVRSAGFFAGDYASVRYPPTGFSNLWDWLHAALTRL